MTTLTRRHWLFGATAVLLLPERTIVLPPAGGWRPWERYAKGGDAITRYGIKAYYDGGMVSFVTSIPLDVHDLLSVTMDGSTFLVRVNEVLVGVVDAATATKGVSFSDSKRYLRRGQPRLPLAQWNPEYRG